jgi:hypothetical protein
LRTRFAKEIEAGATVHLSLEKLQSVDLAFNQSVAPRHPESHEQCIFVALQALGKADQRDRLAASIHSAQIFA